MAGRFPEARDLQQFYQNLSDGIDSVKEPSKTRLKNTTIPLEKDYQQSGYMENIDLFDNDFFRISLGEAQNMDPHQRQALEVAYHTLENSGYNIEYFHESNTSVYVGDVKLDYFEHAEKFDPTLLTGNMGAAIAGRIARFFKLRGKALMVDTTCSSSLVALHLASIDLASEESDMAIVCGVNLNLFPMGKKTENSVGIESSNGKVKAFSAEADGTTTGEAVGCVLLKPLDKALKAGDIIHAVIKGSAVNQDAHLSASLTAPSSKAQSEVILKAWQNAGIDPKTITYIEAHGTGTQLGDPIEIQGMDLAFRKFSNKKHFCAVSSVKTNIGHTDSAAGMAGLIKAILSLKNKVLFPSLHFNKPNPFIDFESSAIYINTKFERWRVDNAGIRRAGISSFGLSGTNCHVVLEEAPSHSKAISSTVNNPYLITISAKSKISLLKNVNALFDFVSSNLDNIKLEDLCYTLLKGRSHYNYRFAEVVRSKKELINLLEKWKEKNTVSKTKSVSKLILVFSNGVKVSPDLIENYRKFPAFNSAFQKCLPYKDPDQENSKFYVFAFQYAFYKLLESCGITSKYFIGDGIGKLVISVLMKKKSIGEGIKGLQVVSNDKNNLVNRCQKLLNKFRQEFVVFAEVLPEGNILGELKKLKNEESNYEEISIGNNDFWSYIKDLYLKDCILNWSVFFPELEASKIELPAYEFNKRRCWLKEPLSSDVGSWFYEMTWIKNVKAKADVIISDQTFLVIEDKEGIAGELTNFLSESGNSIIRIIYGNHYKRFSSSHYEINPNKEKDFICLFEDLERDVQEVKGILHLANFIDHQENDVESNSHDIIQLLSFYYLTRGFKSLLDQRGFTYVLVTTHGNQVLEDENVLPFNAAAIAFFKGVLADFPMLRLNCIDFEYGKDNLLSTARNILNEIALDDSMRFVSYRNDCRYVPLLDRVIPDLHPDANTVLANEGTYLITGGISGIGLEISASIANEVQGDLIILGKTKLPNEDEWKNLDEEDYSPIILEKIKVLEDLRNKYKITCEYHAVDLGNPDEMKALFHLLYKKHKKINGVIHSAGVNFNPVSIDKKEIEEICDVCKPKIQGTILLAEYTSLLSPEFFIMFSSLNAIVPQKNSFDYTVANAFEDAFALFKKAENKTSFSTIQWPGWRNTGMSLKHNSPSNDSGPLKLLDNEDGVKTFYYALGLNKPNLAVINMDLSKFSSNPYFLVNTNNSKIAESEQTPDVTPANRVNNINGNIDSTQTRVLSIWYDVLKSDKIELTDDFFDLGGHSLNGSQILNRIEKEFDVKLEFEELFDFHTVEMLSKRIREMLKEGNKVQHSAIPPIGKQDYYDLSHAQKRLWILDQIENDLIAYNISEVYLFKGYLNRQALKKAYQSLIERHESLRTTFLLIDGEPKQKIGEPLGYDLEYVDISMEEDPMKIAEDIALKERRQKFDLGKGPLIKAKLIRIDEDVYGCTFTMHHITSDGWSAGVLVKEMMILYHAYCAGKESPLSPLRIQYKDFAAWQNNILHSDNLNIQKQYWLSQFRGDIPVLEFPTDYSRPGIKTYSGDIWAITLDPKLSSDLNELSKENNLSLFITLITICNVLLFKYTKQTDIVIGSPTAGRNHRDIENQIGFYLNTIALRARFDPSNTFMMLLIKLRKIVLDAFDNQLYPFDSLVEALDLEIDLSRSPLFDVMVILQNFENTSVEINANQETYLEDSGELAMNSFSLNTKTSIYDLTFGFRQNADVINLDIQFNTDLFKLESIKRLGDYFIKIAKSVVKQPNLPIYQYDPLVEDDRLLLEKFNGTEKKLPLNKTIFELMEEQAVINPERIAVVQSGRKVNYGKLNERVNQLARILLKRTPLVRDDLVVILVERSIEIVECILAVWKCGAAYVPLSPNDPDERIRSLIESASPKLIIGISTTISVDFLKSLKHTCEIVFLDDAEEELQQEDEKNLNRSVNSSDLAYVIFTSGSTGKPKGVMIEHIGMINHIFAKINDLGINEDDVIAQNASQTFDISVWQFFSALIVGGTTVIYDYETILNPNAFIKSIMADKITILEMVPSYLSIFLDALNDFDSPHDFLSLSYILVTGEIVMPGLIKRSFESLPSIKLVNAFGPTEASDDVTHYVMDHFVDCERVPIGRAIQNFKIYIVDEYMKLCPIGVKGEICVSGLGVGRGYLNDIARTKEAFIDDPFGKGARLYKTGDVGKYLADGNIEFFGRNDHQVKLKGYRIELEEIELAINKIPNVDQSVVVVKKDNVGNKQLYGFVKLNEKNNCTDGVIFQGLEQQLPGYMIPSHITILDEMPLTKNGKIDRNGLHYPDDIGKRDIEYLMPENEVEEQLLKIWQFVLDRELIGTNENFFEIGGDSLKAIQQFRLIEKIYPQVFKISDLFLHNSISKLSQLAQSKFSFEESPEQNGLL